MGGKDIIDDLAFIKGVMQAAIKSSEVLNADSNLRPLWQKNGAISFVEINSQPGRTCRIRSPWPGSTITLYRNGVKAEDLTGSLISFPTDTGEDIKIVCQNVNPDSFNENIPVTIQGSRYEAENAALSEGAAVNTDHADYSGTGFVGGYFNQGATTVFNVSTPAQGSYNVNLRLQPDAAVLKP